MIALTRRTALLLAMLAASAALAVTIGAQSAQAAYSNCTLTEEQEDPAGSKPTYNLTLKKKVTSCSTAYKVLKSFHGARTKSKATYGGKVRTNWSCSGSKTSMIPAGGFYGKVTCSWGTRRVQATYQQNL